MEEGASWKSSKPGKYYRRQNGHIITFARVLENEVMVYRMQRVLYDSLQWKLAYMPLFSHNAERAERVLVDDTLHRMLSPAERDCLLHALNDLIPLVNSTNRGLPQGLICTLKDICLSIDPASKSRFKRKTE